jgi:peroxiredoxin
MKKILSIVILSVICSTAFAQKDVFKVKMKIKGLQDSACYLINYFGNQRYYKDTANFDSEGVVVFSGKKHHPGGIYGVFTGGKLLFELVLNGESLIDLETDTLDYINNMTVKKSEENKVFFDHLKLITKEQKNSQAIRNKLNQENTSEEEKKEIRTKLTEVGERINNYRLGIIEKHPELFVSVIFKTMKEPKVPDFKEIKSDSIKQYKRYYYVKDHYFDDVDFSDARINYTPLYHNKIEAYFKNIVLKSPDSIIKEADILINKAKSNDELFKYTVHYLLSHYERSKIMGMDAVFAHIGLNYYNHELAFWADSAQIEKIQERSRKISPLLLGKQAINLSLLDTAGSKWISMNKVDCEYMVLVFWDPDCGHCKKELPKLRNFTDSIKSHLDLKVFAVSSSHDEEWKKFIRDHKLDFINVAVPQAVYKDQKLATEYIIKGYTDLRSLNYHTTYDIYSTPQIYLLDKSKKILAKKLDAALLKEVLEKEEARKNKTK